MSPALQAIVPPHPTDQVPAHPTGQVPARPSDHLRPGCHEPPSSAVGFRGGSGLGGGSGVLGYPRSTAEPGSTAVAGATSWLLPLIYGNRAPVTPLRCAARQAHGFANVGRVRWKGQM